jgi:myo-inositol-hexaphosphate 3-phosphohydrolase/PKD repeat protein
MVNRALSRRLAIAATLWLSLSFLTVVVFEPPSHAAESPVLVPSDVETAPVLHSGDAMDDPAIWVHPTDKSRSLVLGNDKGGALETYDLDGTVVQRLAFGTQFWGNVDVRQGVQIGGLTRDLVGVIQRGARFYTVDPTTRQLSSTTEGGEPIGSNGEGFCMYESPTTGQVYAFSITIAGTVNQFELLDADADGLLESRTVRTFAVGSEAEGCVADDQTGALYISEENEALWRYSAEPGDGTVREAVDVLSGDGGHLINDVEGVTIVDQPGGAGYVIVSVQNAPNPHASYFSVYERSPGNDFVKTFRVANGSSSDDCDRTDGITASTAALGPLYPDGVFICQDNNNDLPGSVGNQNLKLVGLEKLNLDGGEEPPPPPPTEPSPITYVGQAASNANARSFSVRVPSSVLPDDVLLLFASQASTTALTGPGTGWTQVGRVLDTGHATTVWRRAATGADPGSTVRLSTSGGVYTKVGVTLGAYRGVDPDDPLVTIAGVPEPGSSASHTTPVVSNSTTGAWRVSYWSDKNSATTRWSEPDGETVRATTVGSGGGRIGTLLTDPGAGLMAGSPAITGGRTATANAGASSATSWTLLLRPVDDLPVVNQPPVARFTSSCAALVCSFDASTSSDLEDSIQSYEWDFGDGTTGEGVDPQHTYGTAGTREVVLTVTDDDGATDTERHDVTAGGATPPSSIDFVGQATSNANNVAFTARVPGTVEADDTLLLFASQGSSATLTGPGTGWTQIGRVVDSTHATTVWRRRATAADAGSTVRLTSGTTYTKVAMTLAAYRGLDLTSPVVSITGAPEPGTTASHTTPVVTNSTTGAWRVSYWSDKNSATTEWTAPTGETSRATTTGSGGGRVGSLLTDPQAPLTAGTPATTGGLTAVANAGTDKATSWTLLLRPAS